MDSKGGGYQELAVVRCVMEMGMGVDVHGVNYTEAAKRAVFDAIPHSSLGLPKLVGETADDMRVDVTIGVSKPEAVDKQAVLEALLPWRRQYQRCPRRTPVAQ
jgi:uncharacterized protein (TIGR02058 family)